jgi:peptide/nickel transport system substrate-binding protein
MLRNLLRSLTFAVIIALAVGGLIHPSFPSAAQEEPTLTIAIPSDIETLDPPFSRFQRSNETNYNIYDQFFRYGFHDTGQGYSIYDVDKIEGEAIESWKLSDDYKSIVLEVRANKFSHTGNPVTAEDIVYWFKRAYGTDSGTKFNAVTSNIESIDQVKATGPMEVTIQFSKPSPWFFYLFRDQSQAPQDSVEIAKHVTSDDAWASKWLAKNDAGSGEYYVDSWEPGVQMVLKANPNYWAKPPAYFRKVVLKIVPSSANRALLLQQGAVDIASDLSTDELDSLRGSQGVKVLSVPTRNQMILGFNVTKPPFDNVKVRQALTYAAPYKAIVEGVFKGRAQVSEGPVPVGGQFHDKSLWTYTEDLDKAKALLKEAGMDKGFEFTLDITEGIPVQEQIAVLLQDQFSKIGVTMKINKQTSAAFADGLGKLTHQAWMRDLLWYVDDPGYTGVLFFKTGAVVNWTGYSNKDVDKLIDEMVVTVDKDQKKNLATEYQKLTIADAPALYLAEMPFEIAMRDDIQGYVQLPDNLLWYYPLKRATK